MVADGKSPSPESGCPSSEGWEVIDEEWEGRVKVENGGYRFVRRRGRVADSMREWLAENWRPLTADLLQLYGVDVGDITLLQARPWSWLYALIEGVMTVRSRVSWEARTPEVKSSISKALANGADVLPWM